MEKNDIQTLFKKLYEVSKRLDAINSNLDYININTGRLSNRTW